MAAAALAAVVMAGLPAGTAKAGTSPGETANPAATSPAAAALGRDAYAKVRYRGKLVGYMWFRHRGNRVIVCDPLNDRRSVTGHVRLFPTRVVTKQVNNTRRGVRCITHKLRIREGARLRIRVCVQRVRCSPWVWGRS
ncbi:hypothetical protein C1I98_21635 [Spongiactinospora gelatinilytica]|uniref:Uncharacterized protein n=2 Tax=Spongiactinospora gelatinilytica TaxID=2666298 RepID=A0A2W2H4P5_9ACTN|nr:hypothetical protein C1I98_21635 [Spongiactinospora gelatinilytica]